MSRFSRRNREKAQTAGKTRFAFRTAAVAAASSLAVLAVLAASPGESAAYFTAYNTGQWEKQLALGSQTELIETYDANVKTIVIENTGETECYVRVKAFAGDNVTLSYTPGTGWEKSGDDGYWYYKEVLNPGGETTKLEINVTLPARPGIGEGEDAVIYDQNVVVIQESTQVLYRDKEDGTQEPYGAWDLKLKTENRTQGEEEKE